MTDIAPNETAHPNPPATSSPEHWERVANELKGLGVTKWGLFRIESRYLPNFIHPAEHIEAVIYGQHTTGYAVLAATDRRVVFLNKRALFSTEDEVGYDSVTGVTLNRTRFNSKVTLYTRVKEYTLKTSNAKCAQDFVDFIERRCLDALPPTSQDGV